MTAEGSTLPRYWTYCGVGLSDGNTKKGRNLVIIVPKTTIPTVITCCSKLIVTRKPPLCSLLVFLG